MTTFEVLEKDYPCLTECISTALGASIGASSSLVALSLLGYSGLFTAGVTSGLATAGAVVGGGMVAGMGILSAPVVLLGLAGYGLARKRKKVYLADALERRLDRLHKLIECTRPRAVQFGPTLLR
jgi:hypothetical protein